MPHDLFEDMPTSYEEALKRLGGEEKLKDFKDLSALAVRYETFPIAREISVVWGTKPQPDRCEAAREV